MPAGASFQPACPGSRRCGERGPPFNDSLLAWIAELRLVSCPGCMLLAYLL